MKKLKPEIISKRILYEGFNRLYNYTIKIPSLQTDNGYAGTIEREVLKCSDAVVVLIYAPAVDSFILCRQFRTGPFFNVGDDNAFMLQCAAGMIDKDKSAEEIARAEVFEETGLTVENLQPIAIAYASPGRITEKSTIYFAEIAGNPKTGLFGLEHEGEQIQTCLLKKDDVFKMMDDFKIIDAATLLALNWFRANKK